MVKVHLFANLRQAEWLTLEWTAAGNTGGVVVRQGCLTPAPTFSRTIRELPEPSLSGS